MSEHNKRSFFYPEQSDLANFLVASLDLRCHHEPVINNTFRRALDWYSDLYSEGVNYVPFFLVYDMGTLLLEGTGFRYSSLFSKMGEKSSQFAADYQSKVINKLLISPRFHEMRDCVLESKNQNLEIVYILKQWTLPLKNNLDLPSIQTTKQMLSLVSVFDFNSSSVRARLNDDVLEDIIVGYQKSIIDTYSKTVFSKLMTNEDIYILKNIQLLVNDALKISAKQLARIESDLENAELPPVCSRKEDKDIFTSLDDSGMYPQGGLDEISNRGSIENLVRTELVYVDKESEVDLFTMRYLENELLYYTRDEAVLMRKNRLVNILIDFNTSHYIQYPNHPAQISLMVRAMIGKLVDEIYKVFNTDAVFINLHIIDLRATDTIDLWKIRFKDEISRGEIAIFRYSEDPLKDINEADYKRFVHKGKYCYLIKLSSNKLSKDQVSILRNQKSLKTLNIEIPYDPKMKKDDDDSVGLNFLSQQPLVDLQILKRDILWHLLGASNR